MTDKTISKTIEKTVEKTVEKTSENIVEKTGGSSVQPSVNETNGKTSSATEPKAKMSDEEVKKHLDGYIKKVKTLLDEVSVKISNIAKVCTEAAEKLGEGFTAKAFEAKFPIFHKIGFKYFLLIGQGKARNEVIGLQRAEWRDRIVSLPVDEQNRFFDGKLDVIDFKTENVIHPKGLEVDQQQWRVIWNDKVNAFRPQKEQLAWVHNYKEEMKNHKRFVVRSDGTVRIPRMCVLTLKDLADIFFEVSLRTDVNLMELAERKKGK